MAGDCRDDGDHHDASLLPLLPLPLMPAALMVIATMVMMVTIVDTFAVTAAASA
jgi:hypothetical protein